MTLQQILKLSIVPGWIWTLLEADQAEAEAIHDVWLQLASDAAKDRHREVRAVRQKIKDWKEEPGMQEFAKEARMRYLRQQLRTASKEFQATRNEYVEALRIGIIQSELDLLIKKAEGIAKKIRGYEMSIEVLEGKRDTKDLITDEMIERAREYPIDNLLEKGMNGRAKCVFHQGEDYNMDIRKNFAHCYVCGESGDTIKVYRAMHGVTFREAVLALQ